MFIVQNRRHAAAHGRHQGIGGSQIDADGESMLVRRGGLTRLRYLQQGHET